MTIGIMKPFLFKMFFLNVKRNFQTKISVIFTSTNTKEMIPTPNRKTKKQNI